MHYLTAQKQFYTDDNDMVHYTKVAESVVRSKRHCLISTAQNKLSPAFLLEARVVQ